MGSRQEEEVTAKLRLVLYSKPGCHLCDEMKAEMSRAACDDLYSLEEVNIESDPALFHRYRHEIPVLCINGIEAFKYRLQADEFRTWVAAQVGGSK